MHTLLVDAGGPSQRNGAELSRRDETAMTKADIDLMDCVGACIAMPSPRHLRRDGARNLTGS
jgi:hypothetical protein